MGTRQRIPGSGNKFAKSTDLSTRYLPFVIPTVPVEAGNLDLYFIAPCAGVLSEVIASFIEALAADNTNYAAFAMTNLGQTGAGNTAMLAATDANTTKATGGTAIAAHTKRNLSLHGTAANKVVAKGDRIRVRITGTGTLNNTLTGGALLVGIQQTF